MKLNFPVSRANLCLNNIGLYGFYPRDAMVARLLAMALCLSVSVTSRCSVETDERIELVFVMGASFHCAKKIFVYLQK